MLKSESRWFKLNKEQRMEIIRQSRLEGESFAQISNELLGDGKNKSTIWSWAQRNMDTSDIYPKMKYLSQNPFGKFSDVEQWIIFDIITTLFPRLDALSAHLLTEIQKIYTDQHEKFAITAGFLDELETRIIDAISRNTAIISSNVSRVVTSVTPSIPPSGEKIGKIISSPPPPPPQTAISSLSLVGSGNIAELRTDFEKMTMEEITSLSTDFLEALSPNDRNRVQERVKELKRIEKMTTEEREAYLQKKEEEERISEAIEGLGSSLSAMLFDSDSLFSRMRRAADDSEVSGLGTFGKFTIDYTFFYCIACGKMNRTETEKIEGCEYCSAGADQLVNDEEKLNYTYWECLSEKEKEIVDLNYSRGKQIVVKSRVKMPVGKDVSYEGCGKSNLREITSSVIVKADPDKQFSHYLTLFRMYTQLKLDKDLKSYIFELSREVQKIPDQTSTENALNQALKVLQKVKSILNWINSNDLTIKSEDSLELKVQIENLLQDIMLLEDPESPQELKKASELGYITNKVDQILNRVTTILLKIEKEIILPSSWKCSECGNIFELKDRNKFPERCIMCGKVITKLEQIS